MKPYEKYKASEIEWLGKIPEHWEVKRVKDVFKINPGLKNINLDKDAEVSFTPMECLRCGLIEKRTLDYATALSYVPFKNNDILMAKVTPCFENGNIAIAADLEKGIGFGSSEIYVIRSNEKYIDRKLAFYLFQSNYFRSIGISSMKGTGGLKRVDPITVNTALYPYASLQEQTAIASYLDTKTTAIDRKIELLTAKADKYKALRRSLINKTVCRGLNPDVPMKDSGIEWIGMIPEHWEVKRFKSIANTVKGRNLELSDTYFENSRPNLSLEYLRNESVTFDTYCYTPDKHQKVTTDDMIIIWDGAGVGEILKGKDGFLSSTIAKIVVDKKKYNSKFFYHLRFSIEYILKMIPAGMGIPHLNPQVLNSFNCPCPPITEQEEIANYLNEKNAQIETILTNISEQISKLTQLRKTLINDVVTGKIKVTD